MAKDDETERLSPSATRWLYKHSAQLAGSVLAIVLAYFAFGPWGISLCFGAISLRLATQSAGRSARKTDQNIDRPGSDQRRRLLEKIDARLESGQPQTIVMAVEIDQFRLLKERYSHDQIDQVLTECEHRIALQVRDGDTFLPTLPPSFTLILSNPKQIILEDAMLVAARLQSSLSAPIALANATVYLSASVGFCLSDRLDAPTSADILQCASNALIRAQRAGPAAIRSHSEVAAADLDRQNELTKDVAGALADHQIAAFFQPQIATDTRVITGVEGLARWHHPTKGMISPGLFLPACQDAGLMCALGQHMMEQGFHALATWDALDLHVPTVGINFSTTELGDHTLVERVTDTLAQYNLAPHRLSVEVLESVVADDGDGIIIQNLSALSKLGCQIDLDDFGTGHASITNIRRFSIERIKIDRSFITGVDEDKDQRDMVAAILTMAERLGVQALAEGVETQGEERALQSLGVAFLQGFGIAHPMSMQDATDWLRTYSTTDVQKVDFSNPTSDQQEPDIEMPRRASSP